MDSKQYRTVATVAVLVAGLTNQIGEHRELLGDLVLQPSIQQHTQDVDDADSKRKRAITISHSFQGGLNGSLAGSKVGIV